MDELQHECGVAAVYHLETGIVSPLIPSRDKKTLNIADKSVPPLEEPEAFLQIPATSNQLPA